MPCPPKSEENRVRREAKRKGFLLRKSRRRNRWADNYGLYVLVGDCAGNRRPGACAPYAAFRNGEGDTLTGVEEQLSHLSR
jgi:hypothetical protein